MDSRIVPVAVQSIGSGMGRIGCARYAKDYPQVIHVLPG
jgi:hypothetical protein